MTDLMFGPLEDLVRDPQVTDVAVTCDGKVWADRGSGMCECHASIPFRSPQVVREYAVQLCAQLGRRLDDAQPIADASSEDGVRIHAAIAPLVPQGASVSIRLPDRMFSSLSTLCGKGLFPAAWLPLMRGLVSHHATVLITGGTGAGKTTLLKALLGECGPTERVITVEEVRELGALPLTNRVSLATREANVEGTGAIGLPELVKATLRMRPDRVVLGECRGEEIADLLRAYNSGHHGGMTTLHADSVARVPSRLISLGLLAGLAPQAMTMLSHDAFDVVIHVERATHGRHIAQIGRLVDQRGELAGEPLCVWDGRSEPALADDWPRFVEQWSAKKRNVEKRGAERLVVPLPVRPAQSAAPRHAARPSAATATPSATPRSIPHMDPRITDSRITPRTVPYTEPHANPHGERTAPCTPQRY